ncbi:MAG: glycosyltransferase family 4 protein [Nitrospirae bacterium]|nr:glycosyltransferase family 4 protein [Nitrospirota bacterium]
MMKVHFLNVRTEHHSPHSGYDRLMDYIPHTPLPKSWRWKVMSESTTRQLFNKAASAVTWYGMHDLESETNTNKLKPWLQKHVCHFLYGENSVFHIEKSATNKKKIFVTFHQPPSAHQEFVRTREPLKNIDGIIVVGTNQIPFFSQYVDQSRIFFVPHGIDTDFFKPNDSIKRNKRRILFVGNWLRDFEIIKSVAEILKRVKPEILMEVVTLERNRSIFEGIENIKFYSGIPENELLAKYQSASLLLMPMKDCTANNSVLEGMACGLPAITTDIGGIRDYVDDKCAILCKPGDAEMMAYAAIDLLGDTERLVLMSKQARKRAEMFSWHRVSEAIYKAYQKA